MHELAVLFLISASCLSSGNETITLKLNPTLNQTSKAKVSVSCKLNMGSLQVNGSATTESVMTWQATDNNSFLLKYYEQNLVISKELESFLQSYKFPTKDAPKETRFDQTGISLASGISVDQTASASSILDVARKTMQQPMGNSSSTQDKVLYYPFALPSGPISVGDKWQSNIGEMASALNSVMPDSNVPTTQEYQLQSVRTVNGRKVAKIVWNYTIDKKGQAESPGGASGKVRIKIVLEGFCEVDVETGLCLANKIRTLLDLSAIDKVEEGPSRMSLDIKIESKPIG